MFYFEVEAEYMVRKTMRIRTSDPTDPKDPAKWEAIEWEHDTDCSLYDVLSAERKDEDE